MVWRALFYPYIGGESLPQYAQLKSGSDTIKGEGDTQLESEAQLYSYNSVDLKVIQVK